MKVAQKVCGYFTIAGGIAGLAHVGAVNAMTEWGEIVQHHNYSPDFDMWFSGLVATLFLIVGVFMVERDK